jgi:hypothetical protein
MTRRKSIGPRLEGPFEGLPVLMRNRFRMSPKYVVEISLFDCDRLLLVCLTWYPKAPKARELETLQDQLDEAAAPFIEAAGHCSGQKEGDIW